jgi:hypothetical protein
MKTVILAVVAAVALSGSAFALMTSNGRYVNLSGFNGITLNGSGSNSPAVVDLNALRVLRATIRH